MKHKARFLGVPEIFIDGQALSFPFQKARILAFILIEEKSVSKDKLCEYLWADKTIEKGRRNLSNALSYLRTVIPVNVAGGNVSLAPKLKIERDIDSLCRIDDMEWDLVKDLCLPFMNIAEIEEWPSLMDWLLPKRQYYNNILIEALKKRAAKKLAVPSEENYDDAVLCYEKLSECEPYDERIHGELVRLYIKTGQKVKAVDAARAYSMRIEKDLGMKADLADISFLMKRKPIGKPPSSKENIFEGAPSSRSAEVFKMLDFLCRTGSEKSSSCGIVWGEQGIGKTVFISEVTSCLKEKGWECHFVRCSPEEKDRPGVPFIQLLQKSKSGAPDIGNIESLTELNYSRLGDLIYQQVAESANAPHKLLVIEDIQWMDNASWMILETVMWNHSFPRHLLISGFEDIRPAFMIRTTLADEPFEKLEVTLRRFDIEETGRFCKMICPDRSWPDELINEIYTQTEGNPFFIKELVMFNEGAECKNAAVTYKNPFLSVLERFSDEERLFIEAAAISCPPAYMCHIAEALDISLLQVSNIYENIKIHGLLRESREDKDVSYHFTHLKIREIILENMTSSRKRALHISNIRLLEKMAFPLLYRHRNTYTRLSYHCHEAGLGIEELLWRLRELKLHFRAVHEVFPTLTDRDIMHYVPSVDDINHTRRSLKEAWDLMDSIVRSGEGGDRLAIAERDLYILQGAYHWWEGRYEDSRQMLTEGLRRAIAIKDPEAVVEALVQMCFLAIQTDDAKFLRSCASKAYVISSREHLHCWLGVTLRFLAIANILQGKHNEAKRLLQMSSLIFERLEREGSSYTVCIIAAEHFKGDMMLASGYVEAALSLYINCINIGESIGLYRGLGLSLAKSAFCHMLLGDFNAAEKLLVRMEKFYNLVHSDLDGGLQGSGIALGLMGLLNARKKQWAIAKDYFTLAQKLVGKTKRPTWQAALYWSKLELFKLNCGIPEDFVKDVLGEDQRWYLTQMEQMRHKVGWINVPRQCDK